MRKIRAKFSGPRHPWEKARIEDEKRVIREYGLKNKSEIWKLDSERKRATTQAKNLIALTGAQAELEKKQLLERLARLGILQAVADLDAVLGLTLRNYLERRLQTLLVRKGLAHSMKQARQFITHEHVQVNGKTISAPGYLVRKAEEPSLAFIPRSALQNPEHPERGAKPTAAAPVSAPPKREAWGRGARGRQAPWQRGRAGAKPGPKPRAKPEAKAEAKVAA